MRVRTGHARALSRLALGATVWLAASLGRADAPQGRYSIATGTVTDTATGLVWQQAFDPSTATFTEAESYCAGLSLAGSNDWRVPNVMELQTLVDESRTSRAGPAIDTTAFPSTPSEFFWTSSPVAGYPNGAWAVDFVDGRTHADGAPSSDRVRCVR